MNTDVYVFQAIAKRFTVHENSNLKCGTFRLAAFTVHRQQRNKRLS